MKEAKKDIILEEQKESMLLTKNTEKRKLNIFLRDLPASTKTLQQEIKALSKKELLSSGYQRAVYSQNEAKGFYEIAMEKVINNVHDNLSKKQQESILTAQEKFQD